MDHTEIQFGHLPVVPGDEHQFAQVFQNLVGNAIKYRKPDQAPVIHISAEADQVAWIITVCDNGIGFAPEYSERMFGLFKRLHTTEYPGTGLGLAICRRLLQRVGGDIHAESSGEGQGSRFYIRLPACPA